MPKWHLRYSFPATFESGPIICFNPNFDSLFIRVNIYDKLDDYLHNIGSQHGKFWISGPLGGYGKSTMLNYIARTLYTNLSTLRALPFHISVGKKTPTVEGTFYRSFLRQFLGLPTNIKKTEQILQNPLSSDLQTLLLDWFKKPGKKVIRGIQKEFATLNVRELERRFILVLEEVLPYWTEHGLFSKYVLLIDEMDKLPTEDVLNFLSGNQDLFQRLYQESNFVAFISGHSSWVERILDGTEYSYYHGTTFRIPPFRDVNDVAKLVQTRLTQHLNMIPSDNPWTPAGYMELIEMSGGVPRLVIQLAEMATNEAQQQDVASIGPGILRETIVTEKNIKPIEDFLQNTPETFMKLKSAVDKNADSLLYIYYDMPGHKIPKEYDENLTNRTRYLGIEIDNDAWIGQVGLLINLECIIDDPRTYTRELAKDLCSLFDKLSKYPALIQKIVPSIVRKIGKLEPKIPSGKVALPDCQKIIDTCLTARAQKKWFTKKEVFDWFLNTTKIQFYKLACKSTKNIEAFVLDLFEREFEQYIMIGAQKLMIFKEDEQSYYRLIPESMQKTDFLTLRVFNSRALLDSYVDLIVSPGEYDPDRIKRLDHLIEDILQILAATMCIGFEKNFLRTIKKWKIFTYLELGPDLRRRLEFYVRESNKAPIVNGMIQGISRQIILDLAKEYKNILERKHRELIQIKEIIKTGENETIEFKSSMCWDYENEKKSNLVEMAIAKTVSCFMNSEGGMLLIGVGDDKQILGLENDFTVIKKSSIDGFELHFTGLISKYLKKENRIRTKISFVSREDDLIAIVRIQKSPNAVFIKEEGKQKFYVRMGNSCQPLNIEEATNYIASHFQPTQ